MTAKTGEPVWRGIKRYPEIEVSNDGRVRRIETGKVIKPHTRCGYYVVCFSGKSAVVHRLVATAFIRAPRPGEHVRHLNGKKGDNRLENLAIGTPSENVRDKFRHGTSGVTHLTPDDAKEICRMCESGETKEKIARIFGIKPGTVTTIFRGGSWWWVTGKHRSHRPYRSAARRQLEAWLRDEDARAIDLARRAGIPRETVSRLLAGRRLPGLRVAVLIEQATGVPPSAWLAP